MTNKPHPDGGLSKSGDLSADARSALGGSALVNQSQEAELPQPIRGLQASALHLSSLDTSAQAGRDSGRVDWLDGVRALAASFVVLHHVWLMSFNGFPDNNGPWYTGWMVYGHLAVAVFIVISGFSLTLSPSKNDYALKEGGWGFLRRRFWRIVPPYWAALIVSVGLIELGLTAPPTGGELTARDVLLHTALLQDVFGNTPPNGVFWSIAVECQIYLFFPLLLWGFRKLGALSTTVSALIAISLIHALQPVVPIFGLFDRFTPQFFLLFVLGMFAAAASRSLDISRYASWAGQSLFCLLFLGCILFGSRTIVEQYFWIDIVVGTGTALMFVSIMGGRMRLVRRILASKQLAFVGRFAFSLYLIHAPILDLVRVHIVQPLGWSETAAFLGLLLIGAPLAFLASYLFFLGCERPFLRIRSWRMLKDSLRPGSRAPAH